MIREHTSSTARKKRGWESHLWSEREDLVLPESANEIVEKLDFDLVGYDFCRQPEFNHPNHYIGCRAALSSSQLMKDIVQTAHLADLNVIDFKNC